ITFDDTLPLTAASTTVIDRVTCTEQSAHRMVLQCDCRLDSVTFPVTVTQQSHAAVSMDTYQVTVEPAVAKGSPNDLKENRVASKPSAPASDEGALAPRPDHSLRRKPPVWVPWVATEYWTSHVNTINTESRNRATRHHHHHHDHHQQQPPTTSSSGSITAGSVCLVS
ncbi:hypothetical protein CRUP_005521, partial [Coryphaenoides rupestris]